ncbi:MAG: WecB/TagA/CpsF family glycosyltransferase [Bryobacterales bacterium]|nr:WecB/TagA/CpsF family glycosyltransferase [Bryobacteraceae bacterium]MDW8130396.1 WecB/TagA/CpsF family glycosyltransferase [Bryobacterales bacterium]
MADGASRILLIENCDFRGFPPGGQTTFARQLVRAFGDRLALVGAATDGEPVGEWIEQEFEGHTVPFLAVGRLRPRADRPLVPARLRFWLRLRRNRRKILASGARYAIALAPETMMAVRDWGLEVCYHFSGVENPLCASRYAWARPLARWFDALHLESASHAALLLAHADPDAIRALAERSRGRLDPSRLHCFPTCVDPELFRPLARLEARRALGLPDEGPVFVAVGRLSRAKGWDLLLASMAQFRGRNGRGLLVFVGDGEDRQHLERASSRLGLNGAVRVTGFQPREGVARWLGAADAVLFASRAEGWSNAMLEALAAGKPIVSTSVSGAAELVRDGVNGFIVPARDPELYARAMEGALDLPGAAAASRALAERYSVQRMAVAHRELWPPLARPAPQDRPLRGWILDVPVAAVTLEGALDRTLEWAERGESRYVCLATVYSLMLARDDPAYRAALTGADMAVPDGMPLVWCLHWLGWKAAGRVAGPDLVPPLLAAAEQRGIPVGFYGGRPEVLEALLRRVRERFPALRVAYAWAPPFRPLTPEEDRRVVREIRESGARILLVGLGTPKQDFWMAAHRGQVPSVMLGVGQVFDLMGGVRRRAPRWMRRCGLEWLYRLYSEPRRLWRRYLPHNPRFLFLLALERVGVAARRRGPLDGMGGRY